YMTESHQNSFYYQATDTTETYTLSLHDALPISSEDFVESNPDTARKFNDAITKAGEFANDNPDKVRGVLPEFTSLSEEAINNAILPFYDATVSQQDLQDYADLMGEHDFIDEGYVVDGLLWSDDDR